MMWPQILKSTVDCCLFPPILFSLGNAIPLSPISVLLNFWSTHWVKVLVFLQLCSFIADNILVASTQHWLDLPGSLSTCHPLSWLAGRLILLQILILFNSIHIGLSVKCQSEAKKFKLANSFHETARFYLNAGALPCTNMTGCNRLYDKNKRYPFAI